MGLVGGNNMCNMLQSVKLRFRNKITHSASNSWGPSLLAVSSVFCRSKLLLAILLVFVGASSRLRFFWFCRSKLSTFRGNLFPWKMS